MKRHAFQSQSFVLPLLLVVMSLCSCGRDNPISVPELVTVTESSFTVTWTTSAPMDGKVVCGTEPGQVLHEVTESSEPTQFHYVKVDGLEPETKYWYGIESGGSRALAARHSPGRVTTLRPPEGPETFTFAVLTDLHVGEAFAGYISVPVCGLPPLTPGFTWPHPGQFYWQFMLDNAVGSVNAQSPAFSVVMGDLSADFTEEQYRMTKGSLDRLEAPYYVLRGNHDRTGDGQDWFRQVFGLERSYYSFNYQDTHFVCLDLNNLSNGWMEVGEEQLSWLRADLKAYSNTRTFLFAHWPIAKSSMGGDFAGRMALLKILRENPQVIGYFSGHEHRAHIEVAPVLGGNRPYISVPAVKEYPGGFSTVRLFQCGYMYNFWKTNAPECLEWDNITRGEYYGHAPRILFGDVSDRNLVWKHEPFVSR